MLVFLGIKTISNFESRLSERRAGLATRCRTGMKLSKRQRIRKSVCPTLGSAVMLCHTAGGEILLPEVRSGSAFFADRRDTPAG